MYAALLVVGMVCWLAMLSPVEAAPADHTACSELMIERP